MLGLLLVLVTQHVKRQHDRARPVVPGARPSGPVDIEQFLHWAAGHRDGHDAVPGRAGTLERFLRGQRRDVKRWARQLGRAGQGRHVGERVKTTLAGNILFLQQPPHLFHSFIESCSAFVQLDAEMLEFVRQEGAGETGVDAPVA